MSGATPAAAPGRVWRRRLLELGLFVVALYALHAWQTRGAARGEAPALVGRGLEGERVALGEGPALVHFWATWCGVCDAMDDNVASVAEDHRVMTVAVRSGDAAAVRAHLVEESLEGAFPVVLDPGGSIAAAWGVDAFPTTFAVDGDGVVTAVSVGYTTTLGLRARLGLAD